MPEASAAAREKATCGEKALLGLSITSIVFASILLIVGIVWAIIGGLHNACIGSCGSSREQRSVRANLIASQAGTIISMGASTMAAAIVETSATGCCCCSALSRAGRRKAIKVAAFIRVIAIGFWIWLVMLTYGPAYTHAVTVGWSNDTPSPDAGGLIPLALLFLAIAGVLGLDLLLAKTLSMPAPQPEATELSVMPRVMSVGQAQAAVAVGVPVSGGGQVAMGQPMV